MLEELTPESLRVLDVAGQEATSLGHDFSGTEHILLGLLLGDDPIAARVLAERGIVATEVRAQVGGARALGEAAQPTVAPALTARARQVLSLAAQESDALGDEVVRPEHLLLGIIQQATGVAALVLRSMGVELDELRFDVLQAREASVRELVTAGGASAEGGDGLGPSADGDGVPTSKRGADGSAGTAREELDASPPPEVVPPLCPGCGQLLSDVLATTTIVPSGGAASGRRRSYGGVTVIFCGACGHTLSATR
ncbi:MAG TPA: Clp protease N-terminal domain-containing protein [Acidimicrobiales bacterium]|nr:Clp protease N-terminal domain-containing protein [Acidimicrobiales bacterium]